jgi:hypothetical protein
MSPECMAAQFHLHSIAPRRKCEGVYDPRYYERNYLALFTSAVETDVNAGESM